MKKKWFLIIVILLLTGCSVEYNVDINKENVTEQVIIYENQDFYDIYSKTSKLNALKELLSYDEETLNTLYARKSSINSKISNIITPLGILCNELPLGVCEMEKLIINGGRKLGGTVVFED